MDLTDVLEAVDGDQRPALREYEAEYHGEPAIILEIDGNVTPRKAAELEARIWDHMPSHRHLRPDEIGTYLEDGITPRHSDPLALTQLLIAYRLVTAREVAIRADTIRIGGAS